MVDRFETCRVYRATIPLSFLKISDLYTVPTRFYALNEKNQMCELCTFSQIQSQICSIAIAKTELWVIDIAILMHNIMSIDKFLISNDKC